MAITDRFGDVIGGNFGFAGKVCDGARDANQAKISSGGKLEILGSFF